MDRKIKENLFCSKCCLQFDTELWHDLHLSLVHKQKNETESFKTEINWTNIEIAKDVENFLG